MTNIDPGPSFLKNLPTHVEVSHIPGTVFVRMYVGDEGGFMDLNLTKPDIVDDIVDGLIEARAKEWGERANRIQPTD